MCFVKDKKSEDGPAYYVGYKAGPENGSCMFEAIAHRERENAELTTVAKGSVLRGDMEEPHISLFSIR